MHTYIKYKIYLKKYENKLSRIFECLDITELSTLAYTIMATFNTSGKKEFYFKVNDSVYECDEGLNKQENKMRNHSIYKALTRLENTNNFSFIYDYDNKFEFMIEKLEELTETTLRKSIIILEGVGLGIVEDNKFKMESFLNNEISFDELKSNTNIKKIKEATSFSFKNDRIRFLTNFNRIKKKRLLEN